MADNNKSVSGKKQAPKQKKPNFFVATLSELKQVIFLVVLMAIDILLQWIHTELFAVLEDEMYLDAGQIAALIVSGVLVIAAIAGVIAYKVVKSKHDKQA